MKPRHEKLSLLLAAGLLLALASVTASAQVTTADLVGTVRDNAGAVVPGVRITLTNDATGVSRSVTTDDDGNYIFTSLQPGRYSLAAELRASARSSVRASSCKSTSARRLTLSCRSGRSARPCRSAARRPSSKASRPCSAA
jgi:phosphatidate phosphatase APP1